jgi:putative FmdB family regulatory protein
MRWRQCALLAFGAMPIYEYRCPDGHTFEVFQRMSDPPSEACEVCGKSPVEKVLYPVSVHFKGSGFYSTDYGRGSGKKRDPGSKDGSGDSGSSSETKSDAGEKKAAATE